MFPLNFVHRRIGAAAVGLFTGGPVAAAGAFFAPTAGGGILPSECPGIGSIRLPNGKCINLGDLGPGGPPAITPGRVVDFKHVHVSTGREHTHFVEDRVPGTDLVTTGGGIAGAPVIGMFGMAAMEPMIVGSIMDHHGNLNPVRRCMRGTVLGHDDLCYHKIPNNLRKWPKKARAPFSAADAKVVRKAAAARGRVATLAKDVGLTVHKSSHAPRKKKT